MKLKFGPLFSDIFISIYIAFTLYLRFVYEANNQVSPIHSLVMGLSFLTIIIVLVKIKILNPNWFGLFKSKN
jgi:hypothetical protein